MSHDRKPGRVRVMKAGDKTPKRRRHDVAPVVIDAGSVARARKAARRGTLMMTALFLLGAIGAGAATALYLPS